MQEFKPVKVPISVGVKLSADQCPKTHKEEEDMYCVCYHSKSHSQTKMRVILVT
jgi:hypothetical protein